MIARRARREVDPAKKATFTSRLKTFTARVAALEATEASIKATAAGEGVAITEPVPLYMTAALGLVNRTPAAFSEAIEAGNDVAPAVLREQLALLSEHRVAVLAYNEQTTGSTTAAGARRGEAGGRPGRRCAGDAAGRAGLPPVDAARTSPRSDRR